MRPPDETTPEQPIGELFRLCRTGWARGGWRCLLAGLPLALLACSALLILSGFEGLPDRSTEALGHLMRLEGYAFFTGFLFMWFLLVGGMLAAGTWGHRVLPIAFWVILAAIVAFITWILWSTRPGIAIVLQYLCMVAITYLGAFLDRSGPATIVAWLPRVLWSVVAFFITMIATDTPVDIDSWDTQPGVLWAAFAYFSLLAIMELSGVYHLSPDDMGGPRESGRDPVSMRYWSRLRDIADRQKHR